MKQLLLLLLAALMPGFAAIEPKTVLTGTVKDADNGEALVGASVKILKNRELVEGTITDAEGKYRLEAPPGIYEVEVIYTGYVARIVTGVELTEKRESVLYVVLEPGAVLEEVVVSGYSVARREVEKSAGSSKKLHAYSDYGYPATGGIEKKSEDRISAAESSKSRPAAKSRPVLESKPVSGEPAPTTPSADDGSYPLDGMSVGSVPEPHKVVTKVEAADKEVVVPPPGGPVQPAPRAGLLTAGEWNDLHNWDHHWTSLLADGEIESHQNMYGFFPKQRYTVLLTNAQDFPVSDAVVQLKSRGEIIWEARTDNTGKAELWSGLFDKKELPGLKVEAWVNGEKYELEQPKASKSGFNFLKINTECAASKNVDIVWAVDATGSMGDEIEYLKTELLDVIGRAKSRNPELAFRMGTVFYRDLTDAYITKSSGLSPDISRTVDFIKKQFADGGGDYPEAVHSALEEAIFRQKWSENAIARICFLVLDASPHQSAEVSASLQKSIREAARLGIRIVPVAASGIQKDTEFLMKFFGLATNGTYVFLTDHSGIGNKHLEPTTDEYKVEPLNDLLVRLITEYTTIETCEGKSEIRFADDPQQQQQGQNWQAFYYPNPASNRFTLELPFDVQSVAIYNAEGKAVRKMEKPQGGRHEVVVSDLAAGFYTIRILKDGRMQSGKLMVVR